MPSQPSPIAPVRIDPELVAEIDKRRGLVPRTRWINDALAKAVGGHYEQTHAGVEFVPAEVTEGVRG